LSLWFSFQQRLDEKAEGRMLLNRNREEEKMECHSLYFHLSQTSSVYKPSPQVVPSLRLPHISTCDGGRISQGTDGIVDHRVWKDRDHREWTTS